MALVNPNQIKLTQRPKFPENPDTNHQCWDILLNVPRSSAYKFKKKHD
jgi:hypothetical protein